MLKQLVSSFQVFVTHYAARPLERWFMRAHVALYRRTGGRLGGTLWGMPALLLTTTGRKTGKTYTTPLNYILAGRVPVVTAFNSGHRRPPAWRLNLQACPRAIAQIGCAVMDVLAHEADETEHQRLWPKLIAQNPA